MVTSAPPIPVLQVNLFKDSRAPFLALMKEHGVAHEELMPKANMPMAAGYIVEILQGPAPWAAALATVICAFLKNRRSRKVIVTKKDGTVVHCEGLGESEIIKVLAHARDMSAIETKNET